MSDLQLHLPSKVVFGPDSVNRLGAAAGELGERALIVAEPALTGKSTAVQTIREALTKRSIQSVVHDEMPSRIGPGAITKAVTMGRAARAQMVIGVGGASVISAAKCVAAGIAGDASVYQFVSGGLIAEKSLPFIGLPTSLRDPMLLTNRSMVVDIETATARMVRFASPPTTWAIIDPKLGFSISRKLTAAIMMDILLSSIEGYLSAKSTFFSDTLFLRAIDTVKESVDELLLDPEDRDSSRRAAEAGLMMAIGLSVSSLGPGSALAYSINAKYDVPKVWLATVLLPHLLDFHAQAKPAKVAKIARALGEDILGINNADDAGQASTVARRLIGKLELTGRLRELDVRLEDLYDIAEGASHLEMVGHSSVPFGPQELHDLLKQAY
ncbi:MAG: iron-containing alcohol dehydrogenase [Spirochaetaceae bacterium]